MTDPELGSADPAQWNRERAYFDAVAAAVGPFNIELIAKRYEAAMPRPLFPLEVAYSLMGDLKGKRVLDVGCGNGENSLLFAKWGADVTGVDISAGAIGVCRRRAEELGLTTRTLFLETPFELVSKTEKPFDIVWCAAFLHHVLDRLDDVMRNLATLLKPDAFILFNEPVRFSQVLKKIRAVIPPYAEGTPDERPLEAGDLATIEKMYEISDRRLFGPVSRAADRWGGDVQYETATRSQRERADSLYRLDQKLMNISFLEFTAMIMVAKLRLRT